jgi:hypothetical protein
MPEYTASLVGASGRGAPGGVGLLTLLILILSMYFGWRIAGRKGYSPWLGLVLGLLLSLIGLLIVAVLPRRRPRA